jgi:hypothetical protein
MLWEMDGRLGSAWCREGFGGLDWGMARVRKPLSATPLTTRVEGKCKEITSDRSEWGQVPTPLNEFARSFRRQPSSKRDAGIFLSHLEALGIRYALFLSFHIHIHSLHLPTLVFIRFCSSSLKTATTHYYYWMSKYMFYRGA